MGLADLQPNTLSPQAGSEIRSGRGAVLVDLRALLLVLLLALVVGAMAYQAPPSGGVRVGWLGDLLFLKADPGLGGEPALNGALYPDDLTPDSPTTRSRWTRDLALIRLPNLGAAADLDLTITAQGWPADVVGARVQQPTIAVSSAGTTLGSFSPTGQWGEYTFRIPASARTSDDLVIELRSSDTFTGTLSFGADPRPKGLRLAELRVRAVEQPSAVVHFFPPAWRAVLLLCGAALLLYLLLARLLRSLPLVYTFTIIGVSAAGVGLGAARIWMESALRVGLVVLVVALVFAWRAEILGLARAMVHQYTSGGALGYGMVTAALLWLAYTLSQLFIWFGSFGRPLFWQIFPDSLLYGLLSAGLIALVLVLGRDGLPRLADGVVQAIGSRRGALIILAIFGVVWLGYEAVVIAGIPYVGHADYSDNAVVARNLVRGRGWVVDYVTQFYRLYDGITRPQETWPLLQPVWIAPFFLLFGPTAWAAKIPNLFFNLILLVLVYRAGARLWDRRIGLTAAIFVLSNFLFFRLTIYATSDLAFVVFSFGAIYLLYRAVQTGDRRQETGDGRNFRFQISDFRFLLLGSGLLSGLMMLQKPSGAVIVAGMGLWLVVMQNAKCKMQNVAWRDRAICILRTVTPWAAVALLVLSPYLARNLAMFGRPVFSTESYDAWVLGYRGNSGDAWEEIYRIFTPEMGGLGLPDRSWILRWGFDATLGKLRTQANELRDYLMPVWRGLPDGLSWLFSRNERKNIASDLGTWLAFVGVIAALRFRRRLLGLLAAAYTPYMAFMLTYWRTDEHRYWVMLVPWLALLGAWMLWAGYDRLATIGDRRWAPLGLILAGLAISMVVGFSRPDIANKVRNEPQVWAPDLAAYAWIRQNSAPDTVFMSRIPWQMNWHTDRPGLMIPNTSSREQLLTIAQHYKAKYLVLENQQRVKGDAGALLAKLLDHDNQVGQVIDGFELVYASPTADFRAFVYRIPER